MKAGKVHRVFVFVKYFETKRFKISYNVSRSDRRAYYLVNEIWYRGIREIGYRQYKIKAIPRFEDNENKVTINFIVYFVIKCVKYY